MRRLLFASILVLAMVATACGGDGGGGDQAKVADLFMEAAGQQDLNVREDCVRDLTAQLSDADAKALADAGLDGNPQVSAAGDELGTRVFNDCVDISSMIDTLINEITADDDSIDADCLREQLDADTLEEVTSQLISAALSCSLGG